MGLTRLRAEQISDIDYKQAVRVITVANVTLSGGAPTPVDGVNLSAGDRVLVTGQSTGSQNGLYQVETVGSGSNGTWVRTTDGNTTGEIEAGMIVMVTEGTIYADTQWKLITDNPIVIGTTTLTFEQNSAAAFGNIFANGTAVLANSVGSTVTFTAGNNIAITGNNTCNHSCDRGQHCQYQQRHQQRHSGQ
jgi:phage-related tail fiber protein